MEEKLSRGETLGSETHSTVPCPPTSSLPWGANIQSPEWRGDACCPQEGLSDLAGQGGSGARNALSRQEGEGKSPLGHDWVWKGKRLWMM